MIFNTKIEWFVLINRWGSFNYCFKKNSRCILSQNFRCYCHWNSPKTPFNSSVSNGGCIKTKHKILELTIFNWLFLSIFDFKRSKMKQNMIFWVCFFTQALLLLPGVSFKFWYTDFFWYFFSMYLMILSATHLQWV